MRTEAKSSAVVIGASSGVGRALAESLAGRGCDLVVVSRDLGELEALAGTLKQSWGVSCWPVAQDIGSAQWDVSAFCAQCVERLGAVDWLLVPAGAVSESDVGPNAAAVRPVLDTNYIGPARLAAAFGQHMAERGKGHIVLFSSIAAAAPRSKNPAYSAAKAALETYAKGLRHALSPHGVEVHVLALGYVDTRQTAGMQLRFPKAKPEAVAEHVIDRLTRSPSRGGRHYYPHFWWWITSCLRLLPWSLYRRLRF